MFFLVLQVPNITDIGLKPRRIRKVAVIGGGLMGSGIATSLIRNNVSVVMKEINSKFLQKGIKTIEGEYDIPNLKFYSLKSFILRRNNLACSICSFILILL